MLKEMCVPAFSWVRVYMSVSEWGGGWGGGGERIDEL